MYSIKTLILCAQAAEDKAAKEKRKGDAAVSKLSKELRAEKQEVEVTSSLSVPCVIGAHLLLPTSESQN